MPEYPDPPFAEALEAIKSLVPERLQKPLVGIVCGSGLGGIVECIRDLVLVPYSKVPGFAESSGEGFARDGSCSRTNARRSARTQEFFGVRLHGP